MSLEDLANNQQDTPNDDITQQGDDQGGEGDKHGEEGQDNKGEEKKQDDFSPFDNSEGDGEDKKGVDNVDEDEQAAIRSVVQDENQSIVSRLDKNDARAAVNEFLENPKNAVYKDFASKIREYATDPRTKGMNIEAVARMAVDPRELAVKAAEKEREAQLEANKGIVGGSTGRAESIDPSQLPDANSLTPEEFEATVNKSLGRV